MVEFPEQLRAGRYSHNETIRRPQVSSEITSNRAAVWELAPGFDIARAG
jgi:hypothetical protein